jgi:hypothetical protein
LAFTREDGKKVLVDKRHAENAAAVAIEKVKKGMAPALNEAEIRRIAGH